jgi:hypothetical protein
MLRPVSNRHRSADEFEAAINAFLDHHNADREVLQVDQIRR